MSARECRRCGHARDGHPPYIPGADRPGYCATVAGGATCVCWQYIPERPLVPLLRRLLGWRRPRHASGSVPGPPPDPQERPVPCPLPGPEAYNGQTILDRLPSRARPYVPGPRQEPGD